MMDSLPKLSDFFTTGDDNTSIIQRQCIGLVAVIRHEIQRIFRMWIEAILPPAITTGLYFVVFGHLIGPRIGDMEGHSYIQFILPGLIMMNIIMNSYVHTVYSVYLSRFQRNIHEILVAPLPHWMILFGYTIGGLFRALLTGAVVATIGLFFTQVHIAHVGLALLLSCLAALIFSLLGFANALIVKGFDSASLVPNFVLSPLSYLGGVFYSISILPPLAQKLVLLNPLLYLISGFRYALLDLQEIDLHRTLIYLFIWLVIAFLIPLAMMRRGIGIRT